MTTLSLVSKGKAAGGDPANRVRSIVLNLRDKRFAGSQARTAEALGVSGPTVSDLLNKKRGPGIELLEKIRSITGMTLDEIMYGPGNQPEGTADASDMKELGVGRAAILTGWEEAEERARSRWREVPAWAWEAARLAWVPPGAEASDELARDLAYVAWRHTGRAERERLEKAALERLSSKVTKPPRDED